MPPRSSTEPADGAMAFCSAVMDAMRRPAEPCLGDETANAAHDRFEMALLVARANGLDPGALWCRLGLPSYVVVRRPGYDLVDVVDQVS